MNKGKNTEINTEDITPVNVVPKEIIPIKERKSTGLKDVHFDVTGETNAKKLEGYVFYVDHEGLDSEVYFLGIDSERKSHKIIHAGTNYRSSKSPYDGKTIENIALIETDVIENSKFEDLYERDTSSLDRKNLFGVYGVSPEENILRKTLAFTLEEDNSKIHFADLEKIKKVF